MIPVIDISDAYEGRHLARIAEDVTGACSGIGFFQITGFAIDAKLINDAYDAFGDLFARDSDYKDQFKTPSNPLRGYHSFTRSGAAFQESFQTNSIETMADAIEKGIDPAYSRAFEDIHWPEIAGLRSSALALFAAERELARLMMGLFARGLNLAPDYFDARFIPDGSSFVCRSYVGIGEDGGGGDEVLPEHSDSGGITLLHQRGNYNGLQIRLLSGDIVTVPVRADCIVVNVGDLLTRWTNGKLRATPHRVVAPMLKGQNRQSIAMFHAPAVSAEIRPEPELVGAEGPLYEAVKFYDLMLPRWRRY